MNPNVVRVTNPQVSQSVVTRKMVPVTQYVPVDVIEQTPIITVAGPAPVVYNSIYA
jgi:hypothetical protein